MVQKIFMFNPALNFKTDRQETEFDQLIFCAM